MRLEDLPLAAINRLLQRETWAANLLKRHAGQCAVIDVGGISLSFTASPEGLLSPRSSEQAPDVRITIPAASLPSLLDGIDGLSRHAQIVGNAQFAETLQTVMRYLRPDLGAALSPYFGDAFAHRLDRTVLALVSGTSRSIRNATENILEYVRDEKALLTRKDQLADFSREVARLRDDLARLEKRLDRVGETSLSQRSLV